MAVRNCRELGENFQLLVKRLEANQKLLKLLYYTDKDPLSHEDISSSIIKDEIHNDLVRFVPKLPPQEGPQSRIGIKIDRALPDQANNEFRIVTFSVEVYVPITQWLIKGTNLRPFAIMGEIENSLKGKRVNGLGVVEFDGFALNFISNEMTDYIMKFSIETYD